MTKTEMTKRLATMTEAERNRVLGLILSGYGASGIKFETGLTIKQINAVFTKQELDLSNYLSKG